MAPALDAIYADGWQQNNAIHSGDGVNRLGADCIDDLLRFYVNDVLIAEMTDADFASGFSGMIAASLNDQSYEVLFDNFLITQPGQKAK